jgi:hypothetical protein
MLPLAHAEGSFEPLQLIPMAVHALEHEPATGKHQA